MNGKSPHRKGLCKSYCLGTHLEELEKFKKELLVSGFKIKEKSKIKILKSLNYANRSKIILLLKMGIKFSCELEYILNLSQPTISHHIKILEDAGILSIKKVEKWNTFHLVETPIIYWILGKIQ